MVDKERQTSDWYNQELHTERVVVTVVSGLELVVHQEHGEVCSGDEENLHTGVIDRYKGGE